MDSKIKMLNASIISAKESRDSDTKSSAGDKYETGRAMMHIEIDKNEAQLKNTLRQKNEILKINTNKNCKKVEFGSVVRTKQGLYFIAIALGKIEVENTFCYSISLASPIGKAMYELKVGESYDFQGKQIEIIAIY